MVRGLVLVLAAASAGCASTARGAERVLDVGMPAMRARVLLRESGALPEELALMDADDDGNLVEAWSLPGRNEAIVLAVSGKTNLVAGMELFRKLDLPKASQDSLALKSYNLTLHVAVVR